MREIKDDNWIDWLKDNEHSRKLFKKSKWNSKTAVIGAILLFIAIMHCFLFVIKAMSITQTLYFHSIFHSLGT